MSVPVCACVCVSLNNILLYLQILVDSNEEGHKYVSCKSLKYLFSCFLSSPSSSENFCSSGKGI